MNFTETLNNMIMNYGAYGIVIGLVAIFSAYAYQKIKKQTGSKFVASIFLVVFVGMASVAFPTSGQKQQRKDPIGFLQTDAEVKYLIDNGSYVSNNIVHLTFSTRLLPPSAELFLDYIPKTEPVVSTAYTTYLSGTVETLPNVIEFEFENAQSYRWVFYTSYSPGPNVHTNGVAVAEFFRATRYDNVAVPKRATIWENGEMIYPSAEKINLLEEIGVEDEKVD